MLQLNIIKHCQFLHTIFGEKKNSFFFTFFCNLLLFFEDKLNYKSKMGILVLRMFCLFNSHKVRYVRYTAICCTPYSRWHFCYRLVLPIQLSSSSL